MSTRSANLVQNLLSRQYKKSLDLWNCQNRPPPPSRKAVMDPPYPWTKEQVYQFLELGHKTLMGRWFFYQAGVPAMAPDHQRRLSTEGLTQRNDQAWASPFFFPFFSPSYPGGSFLTQCLWVSFWTWTVFFEVPTLMPMWTTLFFDFPALSHWRCPCFRWRDFPGPLSHFPTLELFVPWIFSKPRSSWNSHVIIISFY